MEEKIELSIYERQVLINQLEILKKLNGNSSDEKDFNNKIEALKSGYELHYQDVFDEISDETLSYDECREVLNILEMFRGIIYSYKNLEREKKLLKLTTNDIKFIGFDGNHETKQMLYTKYFICDLNRYSEIQELYGNYFDYNSHYPMINTYRIMLDIWNRYRQSLNNAYLMSEEDICELLQHYNPHAF